MRDFVPFWGFAPDRREEISSRFLPSPVPGSAPIRGKRPGGIGALQRELSSRVGSGRSFRTMARRVLSPSLAEH